MKALVLADIDDLHWHHGPGRADLLISLGDVATTVIIEAASDYDCDIVFAVKGNHDSPEPFPTGITDLHLKRAEFCGLTFGGFNGSWKYKPRGHFLYEQEEVTNLLKNFPHVDVFISHNSPRRVHDKEDDTHFGFDALATYIAENQPRLFLHGHQHVNKETVVGKTRVVGVYGHSVLVID